METHTNALLLGIFFVVLFSVGLLVLACMALADFYKLEVCHDVLTLVLAVVKWGAQLFGR